MSRRGSGSNQYSDKPAGLSRRQHEAAKDAMDRSAAMKPPPSKDVRYHEQQLPEIRQFMTDDPDVSVTAYVMTSQGEHLETTWRSLDEFEEYSFDEGTLIRDWVEGDSEEEISGPKTREEAFSAHDDFDADSMSLHRLECETEKDLSELREKWDAGYRPIYGEFLEEGDSILFVDTDPLLGNRNGSIRQARVLEVESTDEWTRTIHHSHGSTNDEGDTIWASPTGRERG